MDLIHSSLQASFNARIERLAEQETNELRAIFRYFDTDNDGAVSADQAFRMFGVLGLDVNPVFVRELEEVYLAEFLKIVDSNIPHPVEAAAAEATEVLTAHTRASTVVPPFPTATSTTHGGQITAPAPSVSGGDAASSAALDEEAIQQQNKKLWEEEWRTLDSYRRGVITRDELRAFLKSCFSPFPPDDLDRFLELYSDPSMPEDSMTLTKTACIKFRDDYTNRNLVKSEDGASMDEDEGGEGDPQPTEQPTTIVATDPPVPDASKATAPSTMKRRPSNSISRVQTDGEVDEIVIDAGVIDDDLIDEEDANEDHTGSVKDHGEAVSTAAPVVLDALDPEDLDHTSM